MPIDDQYQYALGADRARYQKMREEDLARQQQEQQQEEIEKNKMSWFIFIPCITLSILADITELITLGTIGWFLGLIIDIILLIVLGLSRSGRKQFKKWVIAIAAEKIPVVAFLPFRTLFLIWSFIASRPKMLAVVQKGLAIASKVPSPISAELKGVSAAVDIGAQLQRTKTAGTSFDERTSALTSAYKSFREASKKAV